MNSPIKSTTKISIVNLHSLCVHKLQTYILFESFSNGMNGRSYTSKHIIKVKANLHQADKNKCILAIRMCVQPTKKVSIIIITNGVFDIAQPDNTLTNKFVPMTHIFL